MRLIARDLSDSDDSREPTWSLDFGLISTVAVSKDGATVAIGERPGTVFLVDAARGFIKDRLISPEYGSSLVDLLSFSPDGRLLVVATREEVALWGLMMAGGPQRLARLAENRGTPRSLNFDAQGTHLAVAEERTLRVWDLDALKVELNKLGLGW